MADIIRPATENRIRALPCFSGAIAIEPLKGGLSNESWLVSDRAGRHVVRFGSDYPFHHVIREREIMTARAAHEAGFAPRVEHAEPGIMVSEFIDARTLDAADVCANAGRIGRFIGDFHRTMPRHVRGPGFMFWVFHVIRDYARTLEQGGSRMAERLGFWLAMAEEFEAAQVPLPVVFGHNDLLPANFMDDGSRLWLIDFEYSGFNTALFDIAGAASNAGMAAEQSAELIQSCIGHAPDAAFLRAFEAMQCASLLRETLWSLVSELHLDAPGVDYQAYTAENLARFQSALDNWRTTHGIKTNGKIHP
ncbi:thiamine kinase-like enzyme [Hoeflea marina]|uniref:Thiamine kinase-like enzyme n=1 Tax=Hoeflea marina TaxID=274592 RepID=A0A317PMW1_9HYPH|nr:choline/ethanolamine kinase family protein [Hoeflea marina]PWW02107.1 thiamine kinase-like enzyme [Hoeflea marina]